MKKEPLIVPVIDQEDEPQPPIVNVDPSQLLYDVAYENIGKDISPKYDELGCAESVSYVLREAFGDDIDEVSTYRMFNWLKNNPNYKGTLDYKPGLIIISPTGYGSKDIKNGHVGITGKTHIMSNDSYRKVWLPNFTLKSWIDYYRVRGGYPIYLFERVV